MAITRWNPFAEFEDILDHYNRAMTQPRAASDNGREIMRKTDWVPVVDITENTESFVIKAEVPGINREDVKVSVDNRVLTISGERKSETEENNGRQHRIERYYGSFTRSFSLPENVDEGNIRAEYKDGILTLNLVKQEKAKPRAIEVQVK